MADWLNTALHNADNTAKEVNGGALYDEKGHRVWRKGEKRGGAIKKGERIEGAHIITKENTQLYHSRRRELAQQAAAEGQRRAAEKYVNQMKKGDDVPVVVSDVEGWALANEKMAEIFFKSSSLKSMSDALSVMGRASGMLIDKKEDSGGNGNGHSGIDVDGARRILQINNYYGSEFKKELEEKEKVEKEVSKEVIDAEFVTK
jgi:hypothetical protein